MTWQSLSTRGATTIPTVLCGPILRRVEPSSVTVWLALKEPRTLRLSVWEGSSASAASKVMESSLTPARKIGLRLHVIALTATPVTMPLKEGKLYCYDVDFGSNQGLTSGVLGPGESIVYGAASLPTFALPPKTLDAVRLVHASCRKPHGESEDALALLDDVIKTARSTSSTDAAFAAARPHQLFLTGDQIYADDVADAYLEMLIDAASFLIRDETLPEIGLASANRPGTRSTAAITRAGLTGQFGITAIAGLATPSTVKSHLMAFGEFCAAYLCAWSPALWDTDLPTTGPSQERRDLATFKAGVGKVRRALANVPTYMIFDDHEITDDWFLNRRWCNQVLTLPLGRRIIRNGLAAYAVFQHWGNMPADFSSGMPGATLLDALRDWDGSETHQAYSTIAATVGVDSLIPSAANTAFPKSAGAMRWSYGVALGGWPYEVLVLDTRTRRGYPQEPFGPPHLIQDDELTSQLGQAAAPNTITLVVAQTPIIGVPWVEAALEFLGEKTDPFWPDVEAFGVSAHTFHLMMARLTAHNDTTVVLSGDVHYGSSCRADYWAIRPYLEEPPVARDAIVVQLVSSAAKNEDSKTRELHEWGRSPTGGRFESADPDDVLAWRAPPQGDVAIAALDGSRNGTWSKPYHLRETPAYVRVSDVNDFVSQSRPDWQIRVHFVTGVPSEGLPGAPALPEGLPGAPALPPLLSNAQSLLQWVSKELHDKEREMREWNSGRELVGVNNIGLVSFQSTMSGAPVSVVQELLWRPESPSSTVTKTTFAVSLAPAVRPAIPGVP